MKKLSLALLGLLFIFVSCSDETGIEHAFVPEVIQQPDKPLTPTEINSQINAVLETNGDFSWKSDASDLLLWSALQHGQNILTIGYGNNQVNFTESKTTAVVKKKQDLIRSVSNSENETEEDILIYDDDQLNFIDTKVISFNTVVALKKDNEIRYLEPSGYEYFSVQKNSITQKSLSDSGCDTSSSTIAKEDYGSLPSGAKIPWDYYDHKIDKAWAYSKGRGIGVGIIDTGTSRYQSNLGSKFDDYYSGRSIKKYGTYVDSIWPWKTKTDGPYDKCGHGTSAASTIGGPDNNQNLPVGVAYECNLVTYRGTSDVVLDGYHEQKGVANALKALANRSDVKIISMSIGHAWSVGKIKDAVKYAYSKGKLIFAAGGTSTNFTQWYGVIFPANMSEVVAVTGVEEQTSYNECDVCHTGSEIEFTYVMERSNNHHQPVLGYYDGTTSYFGGSSVATAATAGIAALVWAKNPSWSRNQVLNRLRSSAAFYPNKNGDFGYGNIDALKAVRGY